MRVAISRVTCSTATSDPDLPIIWNRDKWGSRTTRVVRTPFSKARIEQVTAPQPTPRVWLPVCLHPSPRRMLTRCRAGSAVRLMNAAGIVSRRIQDQSAREKVVDSLFAGSFAHDGERNGQKFAAKERSMSAAPSTLGRKAATRSYRATTWS